VNIEEMVKELENYEFDGKYFIDKNDDKPLLDIVIIDYIDILNPKIEGENK